MRFLDGLTNALAQIGFGGDKAASGRYLNNGPTPDQIITAYKTSWLAQRAVDLPVDDATSKWRKWHGDAAKVDAVEIKEEALGLRSAVAEAAKKARIYGGAAIFISTNSSTLSAPIHPSEKIKFLTVFDKTKIKLPSDFKKASLRNGATPEFFEIENELVHASRLAIFKGKHCPDDPVFGRSELGSAWEAIRNSDSVSANIATLVYEAKIDVFKIPDLLAQADASLVKRLQLAQHGKSIVNAIAIDAEESYEQKQINFGGLNDILKTTYQLTSGSVGIPASKLLGQSVGGLNAVGDNEIRDYYDLLISMQNNSFRPALRVIDELMLNEIGAPELDYQWRPLWSPSAKETAEINKLNADLIVQLANIQMFTDEQIMGAAQQLMGDLIPALEDLDNEI